MIKTKEEQARKNFPDDIKDHGMAIILNGGGYRHLRFRRPDTTTMGFDIITWPGHLCYTGDMGTYVFSRVTDMFTFFRREEGRKDGISLQYWAEKVLAGDRIDGVEEYSSEMFKEKVNKYAEEFCEEEEMDQEDKDEFMSDFTEYVLDRADDGEYVAYEAIRSFIWHGSHVFEDYCEWNFKEYTFRYVWACLAIVHGIGMYDDVMKDREPAGCPSLE